MHFVITQLLNTVKVHEEIVQQKFMDINITVQSCTIKVGHTKLKFKAIFILMILIFLNAPCKPTAHHSVSPSSELHMLHSAEILYKAKPGILKINLMLGATKQQSSYSLRNFSF